MIACIFLTFPETRTSLLGLSIILIKLYLYLAVLEFSSTKLMEMVVTFFSKFDFVFFSGSFLFLASSSFSWQKIFWWTRQLSVIKANLSLDPQSRCWSFSRALLWENRWWIFCWLDVLPCPISRERVLFLLKFSSLPYCRPQLHHSRSSS